MKNWALSKLLLLTLFLTGTVFSDETVLLAILARNKAHVLPRYLSCIEALDYDKKAIVVYINTNNNEDDTLFILKNWIEKNKARYRNIIIESNELPDLAATKPHVWTPERFKILGEIRNRSFQMAKRFSSDFYFVIDCDNFIEPCTLRELTKKKKPIIAPMLRAIPIPNDPYSNFECAINTLGYERKIPNYYKILERELIGTFEVPIVHCTYLIQTEYLDLLGYRDATPHHEFVVFSRMARNNGVPQFICNERDFGVLLHYGKKLTLIEEREDFEKIRFE